jgi:predicted lipoprotein with Yx(FWY)xxD motif
VNTHQIQTTRQVGRPAARKRLGRTSMAVPLAMGALALMAACQPYGGTSTAASSASAPASAATGALVAPSSTGLGTILVDAKGRTVYDFANDTGSMSTCTGSCAQEWLPVTAPDAMPAPVAAVPAELGSTERSDGTRQLTVAGHPVYTFTGDSARGQTNGNGITLNGGLWTAVSPDGSPLGTGSSSGATGY